MAENTGGLLESLYGVCKEYDEMVVPVNSFQASIESVDPLRIRLETGLSFDSAYIETYQRIPRGAEGCRVMLIRKRGGQRYLLPYTQFWK